MTMSRASTVNYGDRLINWELRAQKILTMSRPRYWSVHEVAGR